MSQVKAAVLRPQSWKLKGRLDSSFPRRAPAVRRLWVWSKINQKAKIVIKKKKVNHSITLLERFKV